MYCPNCGLSNEAAAKFCANCGTTLGAVPTAEPVNPTPVQYKPQPSSYQMAPGSTTGNSTLKNL